MMQQLHQMVGNFVVVMESCVIPLHKRHIKYYFRMMMIAVLLWPNTDGLAPQNVR